MSATPVISVPPEEDPWNWWYRLCAVWITSIHVLIGVALGFGPKSWTTVPKSLVGVHSDTHIPWPAWSVVFFGLAILIAVPRTRKQGYLASSGVAVVFDLAAVFYSLIPGQPINAISLGFSTFAVLMMVAGARYCAQQEASVAVRAVLDRAGVGR